MELYQLNTFVTVAKTSNVTRAAEILHTTPPSVSNHIRQIEEALEIELFTRTPKGMFITSQGKALFDQACQILEQVEKLKTLARELKSDIKGKLSLAINSTPEFLRIPDIIEWIIKKYAGIKLEIIPSSTGLILDGIEQGTIDCGFAFGPLKENGLKSVYLSDAELIIAIPSKYKDPYQNGPIENLTDLPWVVPENSCPFFEQVRDHLKQCGYQLENKVFANDDITKLALARKGAAVCVLEKSEAQPFIDEEIMVPWTGPDRFFSRLSFVYAENKARDILVMTMDSIIRDVWNLKRE